MVLGDISVDHVAIVDEPQDRRCRITSMSVAGGKRNQMTWTVTPKEGAEEDGSMEACIAVASDEYEVMESSDGKF